VPTAELPTSVQSGCWICGHGESQNDSRRVSLQCGYSWAPPYRFQRITQVLQQAQSGDKLGRGSPRAAAVRCALASSLQLIDLLRRTVAREPSSPARNSCCGGMAKLSVTRRPLHYLKSGCRSSRGEQWTWQYHAGQVDGRGLVSPSGPGFLQDSNHQGVATLAATRDAILRKSLDRAWGEMERLQGPTCKVVVGQMHRVHFRHPLDQVSEAAALMDLGQSPARRRLHSECHGILRRFVRPGLRRELSRDPRPQRLGPFGRG